MPDDMPTCPHDVTLPPPGDPGFCPLCLRAKLAKAEAEITRLRDAAAEFEAAYKQGQPATSVATKAPLPQVDSATTD